MLAVVRDLRERKKAEQALRESEERFRTLYENSSIGLYRTTIDGKILLANPALVHLLGFKSFEDLSKRNLSVEGFDSHHPRKAFLERLSEKKEIIGYEAIWQKKDKTPVHIRESAKTILDEKGRIRYIEGTVEDITEKKVAEIALMKSREELRNLAAHLESIREEERTKVAREIHDELGQSLTALKIDLSWLDKRISLEQKEMIQKIKSMGELTNTTLQTVKRISTELRPGLLDDLGLIPALEWQADEFQNRTGIQCIKNFQLDELDLDKSLATALFRIFQETLTNTARHSKASRVTVGLRQEKESLVFVIKDNGIGITSKQINDSTSYGIIGIRERVNAFGGDLSIKGAQNKGTTVTIKIPIG
jgi:PAS domain S-box-containing protein